jgi:glutathione S-transferase
MPHRFTLHGTSVSGPTYKVALGLSLMGEPFAYRHVDMGAGEHKSAGFLAKNRFGQVPALEDAELGTTLVQSNAILEYLADSLGKLKCSAEQQRCRVREWLFWDFDQLAPPIFRARAAKHGWTQAPSEVLAMFGGNGQQTLRELDTFLDGRSWLAESDAPTVADVAAYGSVHFAPDAGFDLSKAPNVRAWMARVEALPGFGPPAQILPQASRD